MASHALKGQKLLAQGIAGLTWLPTSRPVRAKAFRFLVIYKAFALTGRIATCCFTQGVTLG